MISLPSEISSSVKTALNNVHQLATVKSPSQITVKRVDIQKNIDRISKDYSRMWEYEPGEEREHPEKLVGEFLKDHHEDAIAVAAYKTRPGGQETWVGSAFGYAKRQDHPLEKPNQAAIASVFVDESARLQGTASKMVESLESTFAHRGYNGVQLYASPEGRIVYQKAGFVDGDEMRYKLQSQRLRSAVEPTIHVRQANLESGSLDTAEILKGERRGTGIAEDQVSDEAALHHLHAPEQYSVPADQTAFVAYKNENGQEHVLGSVVAGVWHYPVPPTFENSIRRDLFAPALRIRHGVAGQEAQNVYLALAHKLISHAETHGFTQINVHQAGAARKTLTQLGFDNGIHMQKSLAPPSSATQNWH
jgi:GNAT superfamily N-acetyltransferase